MKSHLGKRIIGTSYSKINRSDFQIWNLWRFLKIYILCAKRGLLKIITVYNCLITTACVHSRIIRWRYQFLKWTWDVMSTGNIQILNHFECPSDHATCTYRTAIPCKLNWHKLQLHTQLDSRCHMTVS